MKTYSISNDISGADLGTWTAESREHALVAQFRDAGLRAEVVDGAVALDPRDVDADGEHLAGRVEDYTISEVTDVIVSTDNGNSETTIADDVAAAAFIARYGERNVARELADAGFPTEDYSGPLAVMIALAAANNETPTLP